MEEKKIEQIAVNKIIEFAKKQSTQIWHQMIMDWNWDNYNAFISWLVENPDTDKATILMIYWKSNPGQKFPHKKLIEKNYSKGFYKQQLFSFNPEDDEGDNWVSYVSKESKSFIPKEMFQELKGTQISYPEGFIEGIPESLFYEIEELYG